jgi:hypothetical protein
LEEIVMKLNVGIVGNSKHWEAFLRQEGVPFASVTGTAMPDDYSAIVSGDDVHDHDLTVLRDYLFKGGAVLCSGKVYAEIRQTTYDREFIKYVFSDASSPFANAGLVDVQSRTRIAWNANQLRTDRNSFSAHKGLFGNGHVVALPFDAAKLMRDARVSTKSFYSPERRLPFERVSTVSKGGVRKIVARALELLHHHRGIPYVHLWYYPSDARTIFAFRVDTDHAGPGEIDDLYRVVSSFEIPASWFVDVKSQQLYLSMFSSMEHQEIGAHCFEHRVFPDASANESNIRQALTVLKGADIKPEGFAAPFGEWNDGLGEAIRRCGFSYSSEFAYDYDNLPSYPGIGKDPSPVLQIPIHPVGIGSLRRQGYSEEQMKRYFDFVTGLRLSTREPLVFYHHPKDGHHDVLKHLFETAKQPRIALTFFGEYANWWKRRLQVNPRIEMSGSTIRVSANKSPQSVWLRISKPNGTEAFSPIREELILDKLSWEPRPLPYALPPDFTRIRKFNYRIPLTRGVDFVTRSVRGELNVDVKNLRAKLP